MKHADEESAQKLTVRRLISNARKAESFQSHFGSDVRICNGNYFPCFILLKNRRDFVHREKLLHIFYQKANQNDIACLGILQFIDVDVDIDYCLIYKLLLFTLKIPASHRILSLYFEKFNVCLNNSK